MGRASKFVLAAIVATFSIILALYATPRANIPAHLLGHKLIYSKKFIPEQVGQDLVNLMKEMKTFPTNAADLTFYKTKHEHIGEAVPINENGKCDHPFLIPNSNRSLCVLPGRVDVARHYILTGGPDGIKESYDKLISRVQSFGRYMFDLNQYPIIQNLFASPSFTKVARAICPDDRQHLDPFQFNIIVQIPGQTVAMHIDAPYFFGATRFQYPQWLLAAMVFSNLFSKSFVDQVQVVGYLHQWTPDQLIPHEETLKNAVDLSDMESVWRAVRRQVDKGIALVSGDKATSLSSSNIYKVDKSGEFVFWDDASPIPKREQPTPLAGSAVDGSKLIHAAVTYRPNEETPFLDKSKKSELVYNKATDKWDLVSGDEVLRSYGTDDLRISIVYRARCMLNEEERKLYNKHQYSSSPEEYQKNEAEYQKDKAERKAKKAGKEGDQGNNKASGGDDDVDGCASGKCRSWEVTTLDSILQTFVNDMVSRGIITAEQGRLYMEGPSATSATTPANTSNTTDQSPAALKAAARLDLAMLIMDTYIKYPLASQNEAVIPYNYCAIGAKYPQLTPLLKTVC